MKSFLIVVALAMLGVVGDFFIKLAGNNATKVDFKFLTIGSIIYFASAFGWLFAMRHLKLATLGTIYALATSLLLVVLGVGVFREQLRLQEIVGVVLAATSLALLGQFN